MKIVIDTSVVAKLFLEEEGSDQARDIVSAMGSEGGIKAHAPTLLLYELNGVLINRLSSVSEITAHMDIFFELIEAGAITLHEPTQPFLQHVATVAETDTIGQGHISPFDATFHTLALELGAVFVTADETHCRKTNDVVGSVQSLNLFHTGMFSS